MSFLSVAVSCFVSFCFGAGIGILGGLGVALNNTDEVAEFKERIESIESLLKELVKRLDWSN